MMSKGYFLGFYTLSIYFFMNFSNSLILWIFTELNLISFIMIMIYYSGWKYSQEMNDLFLFYFVIQCFSSSLFLANFFFFSEVSPFHLNLFFVVSMILKLGIFPLFYWVFKIRDCLDSLVLCLFLSIQKIPFFFLFFSNLDFSFLLILLGSFISGSTLIFFSKDFKHMIICSSISYSFWTIYLYFYGMFIFFSFYISYGTILFLLLNSYLKSKGSFDWLMSVIFFSFFLGLSPFSLFFFKYLVMENLFFNFGMLEFFLFWLFSFLALLGYMKYFFKSFLSSLDLYEYIKFWKNKMFVMSLTTLFCLGFLL